jgi:hypothetical protein
VHSSVERNEKRDVSLSKKYEIPFFLCMRCFYLSDMCSSVFLFYLVQCQSCLNYFWMWSEVCVPTRADHSPL